ncbi:hypothetical protein [Mesorhizobium sp. Cs1299R1N1]|uniref:hypothetical protein n=1 Tax=Mesorhizobium sp. Cs1299R1N1 TaxID=3015172 RepID=UPI003FA6084A
MFLIRRGRLRMIRHLASGEAVIVHTGQAGELFAGAALFAPNRMCRGCWAWRATRADVRGSPRRARYGRPGRHSP